MAEEELYIVLKFKAEAAELVKRVEKDLQGTMAAAKQAGAAGSQMGQELKRGAQVAAEGAEHAKGAFSGLGGVVKAAVGVIAVGAVVELGRSMVMAASDIAESQSKVNTVFGAGAAAINEFAANASQKIGLSKGAALDAAGSFGNMFTQLKLGGPAAASMSKEMLTLAADFASFHNADISDVIAAQTAAFRGEFDSVQRFVPTINAAAVAEKALEMTHKSSTSALTDQDKALAVHALLLAGAGAAAGDFSRTQDGAANAMRIIKASFSDVSAEIGGVLLPAITPMISAFAQGLPAAFTAAKAAFATVQSALEPASEVLWQLGQVVEGLIIPAFKDLMAGNPGQAFDSLGTAAVGAWSILQDVFAQLGPWLQEKAQLIITQLAAWGQAFVEWIGPKVAPMLAELQRLAGSLIDWALAQVPAIQAQLLKWADAFIAWVGPKVQPMLDELLKLATSLLTWASAQVPKVIAALTKWGDEFIAWVSPRIVPLLKELGVLAGKVLDFLVESTPPLAQKILQEWVPPFLGWVAKAAIDLLLKLPEILTTIGGWIVNTAAPKLAELAAKLGLAMVTGIVNGLYSLKDAIWGKIKEAWDEATSHLPSLSLPGGGGGGGPQKSLQSLGGGEGGPQYSIRMPDYSQSSGAVQAAARDAAAWLSEHNAVVTAENLRRLGPGGFDLEDVNRARWQANLARQQLQMVDTFNLDRYNRAVYGIAPRRETMAELSTAMAEERASQQAHAAGLRPRHHNQPIVVQNTFNVDGRQLGSSVTRGLMQDGINLSRTGGG